MSEKGDYLQLELFSPQQKILRNARPSAQGKFIFGQVRNYEKTILAIVVLLITGIVSFSLGVEKGRGFVQKTKPVSSQTQSDDDTLVTPRVPLQPKIEKKETIKPAPPRDALRYYTIQLASYQNKTSAQKEAETLKKKGFLPLVFSKGKYTVVCTGNFPDKKNALSLLPELKKKYRDCFIRRL